jgi:hypothetical protein
MKNTEQIDSVRIMTQYSYLDLAGAPGLEPGNGGNQNPGGSRCLSTRIPKIMRKLDLNPINRLADISECRDARREGFSAAPRHWAVDFGN